MQSLVQRALKSAKEGGNTGHDHVDGHAGHNYVDEHVKINLLIFTITQNCLKRLKHRNEYSI